VLIGPAIDHLVDHAKTARLIHEFLQLSHIKKLLPGQVKLDNVCICNPNMVVGTARQPYGHRLAILGDMATARLYKDGILTACQTAQALSQTIMHRGVDVPSLARGYWPVIRKIRADNRYGRWIFAIHNLIFRSSVLSRIIYQAIIAERKTTGKEYRRLERILWQTASGDEWYRRVLTSMFHPLTIGSVLARGLLLTLRNYLTELIFGLRWQGFGRFTTGVSKERLELKRREYAQVLATQGMSPPTRLEFERMYSIKIKADRPAIAEAIGMFGEKNRSTFTPRIVQVRRTDGQPNQPGCIVRYDIAGGWFCFSLILVTVVEQRYFLYRVRDGFARDGILVFEIETVPKSVCLLSIYVVFAFYRGRTWVTWPLWLILRCLFPAFVHDVLWNHSLCQLKDHVEANRMSKWFNS
jgi:hypothetical protein